MPSTKDFSTGMNYGLGVDDVSGDVKGAAVTGKGPTEVLEADGGVTTFRLQKIDSVEDLQTSMGLSIEASGSYGCINASNKFNFAKESKLHSFSVFLLVTSSVRLAAKSLSDEQLNPNAKALLADGKFDRFRQQFGDLYVKSLITGGEYYAVFELKTQSTEDKKTLSETFEGHAMASLDLAVGFTESMKKAAETHQLLIHSFQQGGGDAGAPTTPEGIISHAANFTQNVRQKPFPHLAFLQDYTTLDLPDAPNQLDVQNAKEVLAGILRLRTPLVNKLNDIDYILLHPDQFEKPNVDVATLRNQVADAINGLTRAGSQCINSIKACAMPHLDDFDLSKLPKRLSGVVTAPVKPVVVQRVFQQMIRVPHN